MNVLDINSTLTRADWLAYQAAWAVRMQRHSRLSRRMLFLIILFAVAMGVMFVTLARYLDQPVPYLAIVIGAAAAMSGIMINLRRVRAVSQPDEHGAILGPARFRFNADGIHVEKPHSRARHDWSVCQDVTRTPQHLFVWIDRIAALIVPLRDLPPGVTPAEAESGIRTLASSAAPRPHIDNAPTETPPSAQAAPEPATPLLRSIARLLMLRSVERPALELGDRTLLVIALGYLGLWLVVDRLFAGPDAAFYAYGVLGMSWYVCVMLLTAALWSRLSQPQVPFRSALTLLLGFVPVATVLTLLIVRHLPESTVAGALILVAFYAAAYGHTGLRCLTARHQPQAALASALVLSFAAAFAANPYVTTQFWYSAEYAAEEEPQDTLAQWQQLEPLLFQQAERIDAQVAALERPDALPAAGFFVGFAGVGEQRVFAGEIALANTVIAEKFATQQRSLQLINDRRDLTSQPFATPSALRHALAGVAQRMNPERDVLFLALSSHGSENGELSVSNAGMPVNNLSADALADALAASGIRWRVIVVSACYAGQFIEPLRDDHTIVIAAAAPDRTSFGCADDRDLTYFGEAFYRDALPAAPDLRTAFQRARDAIAAREHAEGIEASNPQAHFGSALERHLRELQISSR